MTEKWLDEWIEWWNWKQIMKYGKITQIIHDQNNIFSAMLWKGKKWSNCILFQRRITGFCRVIIIIFLLGLFGLVSCSKVVHHSHTRITLAFCARARAFVCVCARSLQRWPGAPDKVQFPYQKKCECHRMSRSGILMHLSERERKRCRERVLPNNAQ